MEYIKWKEWPPDRAKKAYDEGYYIEAMQTLHGMLEIKCQELFMLIGAEHYKQKHAEIWDISNEIPFNMLLKVLFVLGQISKEEFDNLQSLNSIRNKIIHQMFKEPYEKEYLGVPKNIYDEVFNRSLEFTAIIEERIHKIVWPDTKNEIKEK